ncbi:hypothetical protein CHS0354_008493 [Potamilus streckersoni]|uniref:Uncharacterized protein n=1 Tax=Potamilus streckersoni TaxID=2493646 RepID=A0AAE0S7U0_9BIVA|nr:hypothetical protein CHS0354_008493 [Potamilus streckersoni]
METIPKNYLKQTIAIDGEEGGHQKLVAHHPHGCQEIYFGNVPNCPRQANIMIMLKVKGCTKEIVDALQNGNSTLHLCNEISPEDVASEASKTPTGDIGEEIEVTEVARGRSKNAGGSYTWLAQEIMPDHGRFGVGKLLGRESHSGTSTQITPLEYTEEKFLNTEQILYDTKKGLIVDLIGIPPFTSAQTVKERKRKNSYPWN